MWMASGFIHQAVHGEERPEDIGDEYFNHLLRKSFFERYSQGSYVMHDLMHDLAQNVSIGECCRVELDSRSDLIPCTAQHVSIHNSKIGRIFNLRNLRTLIITFPGIDLRKDFVLPNGSLKETLRLLVINGTCRCQLPEEEIGRLIHLRFLKYSRGYSRPPFKYLLPNTIYKLYHLQVLDIFGGNYNSKYEGVETSGITNLVSLRYMNLPDQVMQNIHRVHKLTSLQELEFFIGIEHGFHIEELGMLEKLRSLSIEKIENVSYPIEATNANLLKKENLISLSLNWTKGSNSDDPEKVIDNLQPNPNLKNLTIKYYTGHRSPNWMSGSSHLHLSSLKLGECPLWESLPFLGKIPHLKELSLEKMDEVKELDYSCGSTSDYPFPSLELLYCYEMPKWESWAGSHNCFCFPNLKELIIIACPNLAKLPTIPFSLIKFEVINVGLHSLSDMHHGSSITDLAPSCMKSSINVVKIIDCPKLTLLNGFMQQQNLDLEAIEKLTIEDCKNLLQLPTKGFEKLTSLKYLIIKNSPNLTKLPNLPLSLIDFTIDNVAVSDLPEYFQSSCSSGQTSSVLKSSLRDMKIYNCSNLTSLKGFLQQDNIDLRVLKELKIKNCENLVQLPTSAFGKFVSLKELVIRGCPKLVLVDNQIILLPVKLESLIMENCGELDVPLLESASQLSTLTGLYIETSANISCIPSSENAFTSLSVLKIYGCKKLIELPLIQQTHTVNPANNLVSLKISSLYIDHLCLLLIEPLRFLRFVSSLEVSKCSGMEALPEQWLLQNSSTLKDLYIDDASSLRSLPSTMVMLTALKELYIGKATFLQDIPELPTSLISKNIYRD